MRLQCNQTYPLPNIPNLHRVATTFVNLLSNLQVNRTTVVRARANCRLLWHGTSPSNVQGILAKGFQPSHAPRLDAGWFGRGTYFTSSWAYAARYVQYGTRAAAFRLLLSSVALGANTEITDFKMLGKPCAPGFDSHSVGISLGGGSSFYWGRAVELLNLSPDSISGNGG